MFHFSVFSRLLPVMVRVSAYLQVGLHKVTNEIRSVAGTAYRDIRYSELPLFYSNKHSFSCLFGGVFHGYYITQTFSDPRNPLAA